jgi:hypothetical protein
MNRRGLNLMEAGAGFEIQVWVVRVRNQQTTPLQYCDYAPAEVVQESAEIGVGNPRAAMKSIPQGRIAAQVATSNRTNPATATPACPTMIPIGRGSIFQWKFRFRYTPPAAASTKSSKAQAASAGSPTVK